MITFTPKTEDELNQSILLPKGEYDFDVLKAEDTVSKQGNDMIKLSLRVYGPNGETTCVFDYLLSSLEYKVKHFCDSTGLVAEYEAGSLSADMCANRSGKCKLGVEVDKSGTYDDKNTVKDYVAAEKTEPDVPF